MDTKIICYRQHPEECDEESYTCEKCGKTMCFSHSHRAETSGSDETMLVCADCVAR